VRELATADDLAAGMAGVASLVRRASGSARVEWWATDESGAAELAATSGDGLGRREYFPIGRVGAVVTYGGCTDPRLAGALSRLEPIVRRRSAEERLARTTVELARRNEALEDFAALVAHELKAPLHAALVAGQASGSLEQAIDLVDGLLEAAQAEAYEGTFASAAEALEPVLVELQALDVETTAHLTTTLPLGAHALRVILRNLVSNAVAAGARHIDVTARRSPRSWQLVVDDDGVGLDDDGYAGGSGLGLELCRRLAARFDGVLVLAPRRSGGTRATLAFGRPAR
jgi:signal transduction histidine kinase